MIARARSKRGSSVARLEDVRGAENGRDRIPQLVGEHGEETVLLPIRLFECHGSLPQGLRRGIALGFRIERVALGGRRHAAVDDVEDAFARLVDVGWADAVPRADLPPHGVHQHAAEFPELPEDLGNRVTGGSALAPVVCAFGLDFRDRVRAERFAELVDERREMVVEVGVAQVGARLRLVRSAPHTLTPCRHDRDAIVDECGRERVEPSGLRRHDPPGRAASMPRRTCGTSDGAAWLRLPSEHAAVL